MSNTSIVRLLTLLIIVGAIVAGTDVSGASAAPQDTLNAAASYVANRPVTVECISNLNWIHYGQDFSDVEGLTFPTAGDPYDTVVYIDQQECQELNEILTGNFGDVGPADSSEAIHTLVHEAVHLLLHSTDEHLVDCTALTQYDLPVAEQYFGISPSQQVVTHVPVRKHGRIVRWRTSTRSVPSEYLARFETYDIWHHNNRPAPYNGAC